MPKTEKMSERLLDAAYSSLELADGALIPISIEPSQLSLQEWLDWGEWLSIAKSISKAEDASIERIFFVGNEPVIVVGRCENDDPDRVSELYRSVWSMARPSILFLDVRGELRVYGLNWAPERTGASITIKQPLDVVRNVAEVAEALHAYHRNQVETGRLFEDQRLGTISERADRQLIRDLKTVRNQLRQLGLDGPNLRYAHALIGRSIFIRYLEDRGILDGDYFQKVARQNIVWQELLNAPPRGLYADSNMQEPLYVKVLADKEFTYALFDQLAHDFNGDMFPDDGSERAVVTPAQLERLQAFLVGDTSSQQPMFLWAYRFDVIPIELISCIYEEFYHREVGEDINGTHYTPSSLVDYVLSQLLTPAKLARNPRVLDPACGSGTFLVSAFQRMVRYRMRHQGGTLLDAKQLREILRKQIAGIEVNEEAVRIAAFSLYLALLNFQDPPSILEQIRRGQRLPNLQVKPGRATGNRHYNILLEADAFDVESSMQDEGVIRRFQSQCADVVVANPPWGKAGKRAIAWCRARSRPIGDTEYSQAFIWRALDLLRPRGRAGMLVSTSVLFKRHERSIEFREQLLGDVRVRQVVNFAHVRHIFFSGGTRGKSAISPFAYIDFENALAMGHDHLIEYWSAKRTSFTERQQVVNLNASDLRLIDQARVRWNHELWKIYWWGNHRDEALISALQADDRLSEVCDHRGWRPSGQGFKEANKRKASDWLTNYMYWPTRDFHRYGPTDLGVLRPVPKQVESHGTKAIYAGFRLLMRRGIEERGGVNGRIVARLETGSFCFRNSIQGIPLVGAAQWEGKVLLGLFWSSLARYYFFLTAGSWGPWRHEIYIDSALDFPIRFPEDDELRQRIITIVDELRSTRHRDNGHWSAQGSLFDRPDRMIDVARLEAELDEAVFDLYELTESERDLVRDMCNVGLEYFYNRAESEAVKQVAARPGANAGGVEDLPSSRLEQRGLEPYLAAFLSLWNAELEPEGEFTWRVIGLKARSPMLAITFSTRLKGAPPMDVIVEDDEAEWAELLVQLGNYSQVPLSKGIYIEGLVRMVTDTDIVIIKRNEQRLWTRSMAYEDAEAALAQALALTSGVDKEPVSEIISR